MPGQAPSTITVELPPEAAEIEPRSPEELATELRLLWIIDRVRAHRISVAKGAELAGMDRGAFAQAMREHSVPVIAHSAEDL